MCKKGLSADLLLLFLGISLYETQFLAMKLEFRGLGCCFVAGAWSILLWENELLDFAIQVVWRVEAYLLPLFDISWRLVVWWEHRAFTEQVGVHHVVLVDLELDHVARHFYALLLEPTSSVSQGLRFHAALLLGCLRNVLCLFKELCVDVEGLV